jgi:hypothetical protein
MNKNQEPSFSAPIPGMSLTTEPGNRPWENPPQLTDVEDVLEYYISRIGEEERTDDLLDLLESQRIPVNTLVDSMMTAGAMSGLHTVESGMLAAPVISEFVQALADIEDVKYVVSSADRKKGLSESATRLAQKQIEKELNEQMEREVSEASGGGEEEGSTESEDSQAEEGAPTMKRGLMARPVAMVAEVAEVEVPEEALEEVEE